MLRESLEKMGLELNFKEQVEFGSKGRRVAFLSVVGESQEQSICNLVYPANDDCIFS